MAEKRDMIDLYGKPTVLHVFLTLFANILIVFGVLFWIIGSIETGLLTVLVGEMMTRIEAWFLSSQLRAEHKAKVAQMETGKLKLGKL
jgi:hypothetical protein